MILNINLILIEMMRMAIYWVLVWQVFYKLMLYSLVYYIRSVYYNTFPLTVLFQAKFTKVNCTANGKNAIKYELKKEKLQAPRERHLLAKKRKYLDDPEKTSHAVKKRYHYKNKSIKQYGSAKYLKNQTSKLSYHLLKWSDYTNHLPKVKKNI